MTKSDDKLQKMNDLIVRIEPIGLIALITKFHVGSFFICAKDSHSTHSMGAQKLISKVYNFMEFLWSYLCKQQSSSY
jgi:hypothetical protein